jgi:hypothetical protein
MILSDASTIQAQPVMREEELHNARVERSFFLRPSAQGVGVIKIPPRWTWQLEPVKRVLECLKLKDNWDSYGGKTPTLEVAYAVIDFIDSMPSNSSLIPRIVPLSTGAIQLEFSRGGKELEIEFTPDGRAHYLESENDKDKEGLAVLSPEQISSWMTWLTAA